MSRLDLLPQQKCDSKNTRLTLVFELQAVTRSDRKVAVTSFQIRLNTIGTQEGNNIYV